MRRLPVMLLLLTAVLAAGGVSAQTKTGTTIGQFLGIEPSARHGAMGNAGVAIADGIEAVYFNPGVIGALERPSLAFAHSEWFADINFEYLGVAVPFKGFGTVFASVTALNSGDIDVRTVEAPLGTGEKYDVANTALSLGYGRRITSRFTVGAQTNFVHERIWHSSLSTLTFSTGTVYRLTDGGVQLGFSMANLGTRAGYNGRDLAILYDADPDAYGDNSALPAWQQTDEFPVPIQFRIGLAVPRQFDRWGELLFAVDALHPNDNTESVNLGAEWILERTLALRAGYQTLFQQDSELGLTLGFGIKLAEGRHRFGYAWADHERLGSTHRMTLVLGL